MNDLQYTVVGSPGHGVSPTDAEAEIRVEQAKSGDCGIDLYGCFSGSIHVAPGYSAVVPAGIAVKIPDGNWGLIKARSSTYRKHGLLVVDAVIDSGYTGPIFVHVFHPGLDGKKTPVVLEPWCRLAQLIIMPFLSCQSQLVEQIPQTARGSSGFGSTGR